MSFFLEREAGHEIHVACHGNPQGRAILFLHGGPGSGCNRRQRDLFDPQRDFAIFMDQRGAGQSHPARARHANTTADLIGDIEALRAYLGLPHWHVVGGSWGATLALAYAQRHPRAVTGLALRAVFLGTRPELDMAFVSNFATFHPALYREFLAHLPMAERADPLASYWARILHPDPAIHAPAAWIWHDVERALSQIAAPYDTLPARDMSGPLPATPFMEAHYFAHDCFLEPEQLLRDLHLIRDIPAVLVQARHDLLCPPATTARLAADWPLARIVMAEAAGHGMDHPAVFTALREAIASLP